MFAQGRQTNTKRERVNKQTIPVHQTSTKRGRVNIEHHIQARSASEWFCQGGCAKVILQRDFQGAREGQPGCPAGSSAIRLKTYNLPARTKKAAPFDAAFPLVALEREFR